MVIPIHLVKPPERDDGIRTVCIHMCVNCNVLGLACLVSCDLNYL